jgi:4a-hydroxytetrahydrobiopterin dehydratase
MKPSSATRRLSRTKARNAALLNQLATPGLGSLLARRWIAGAGQLLMAGAGFALVMVWFGQEMAGYYGQIFNDTAGKSSVPLTLLFVGIGFFALSWCWSLVTSFSLLREASRVSLESLESFAANQIKMDEARIILSLSALPDWKREGQIISRTFEFADFVAAMKFVNVVGDLAEQAQHHPDIDIRWNKVTLALTTHDAGGLTEKDFALARQCDSLAAVR